MPETVIPAGGFRVDGEFLSTLPGLNFDMMISTPDTFIPFRNRLTDKVRVQEKVTLLLTPKSNYYIVSSMEQTYASECSCRHCKYLLLKKPAGESGQS